MEAIAIVTRFVWCMRSSGWANRPAYGHQMYIGLRAIGWTAHQCDAFLTTWALDHGGIGPLPLMWTDTDTRSL